MYTCALDEGAVARAFGDCRDPLGPASSSPRGGEALAPAEAALSPSEAAEALRACAWALYAEVPVALLGPAARLRALLENISGKRGVEAVVAEATRVRAPPRLTPSEVS